MKPIQLLSTPPHDPQNPNCNQVPGAWFEGVRECVVIISDTSTVMSQAKHCYYKYNEFFRCEKFHGEKAKECEKIKYAYMALCPKDWVIYFVVTARLGTASDISLCRRTSGTRSVPAMPSLDRSKRTVVIPKLALRSAWTKLSPAAHSSEELRFAPAQ